MEGLRKRAIVLAGVFVVVGIGFQALSARAERITRTESWMIKVAPKELPGYTMVPSRDPKNPDVTYTSDPVVYETLIPYGIVAREFREKGGPKHFDVNVIASSTKDSFHDPRVCFTAQGWNLDNQKEAIVKTATRGDVPVTLAEMNHADYGKHPSVFFYKGPEGFTATTAGIKIQMLKKQFMTLKDQEGVFYRFIALSPGTSTDDLLKFVGEYLDESGKTSDGFF